MAWMSLGRPPPGVSHVCVDVFSRDVTSAGRRCGREDRRPAAFHILESRGRDLHSPIFSTSRAVIVLNGTEMFPRGRVQLLQARFMLNVH